MDERAYRVCGGRTVSGKLNVQGSKNALLPILAGVMLRPGVVRLHHVPDITDKDAVCEILEELGCRIAASPGSLTIDAAQAAPCPIPQPLMAKTRGAFVFLGAMLSRFGRFSFSLPGGCMLGRRPVDFHLQALSAMGASFSENDAGGIDAACPDGLTGAHIALPFPSVGATQNILLAACGARGETILDGAACEPEVLEFSAFLRSRGFDVSYRGGRRFTVSGAPELCKIPLESAWTLSADRIAAATYLCAAAVTGGTLSIPNLRCADIRQAVKLLRKAGCFVCDGDADAGGIRMEAPDVLHGLGSVVTAPHPGFATDMQPLFLALSCFADGESRFTETIFENRFSHCAQLSQMGADIRIRQKTAYINRNPQISALTGRDLLAADLRGGAALTIAALGASGESRLYGDGFIRRGYEDLFGNLNALGASITPL